MGWLASVFYRASPGGKCWSHHLWLTCWCLALAWLFPRYQLLLRKASIWRRGRYMAWSCLRSSWCSRLEGLCSLQHFAQHTSTRFSGECRRLVPLFQSAWTDQRFSSALPWFLAQAHSIGRSGTSPQRPPLAWSLLPFRFSRGPSWSRSDSQSSISHFPLVSPGALSLILWVQFCLFWNLRGLAAPGRIELRVCWAQCCKTSSLELGSCQLPHVIAAHRLSRSGADQSSASTFGFGPRVLA